MSSQGLTIIAIAALIALMVLSYFRTRNKPQDKEDNAPTIKETISQTREYLGLSEDKTFSRVATAFDMAPAKLVSDMSKPAKNARSRKKKK